MIFLVISVSKLFPRL